MSEDIRWEKRRARIFRKVGETASGETIWAEPEYLPLADEDDE